MNNPTAVEWFAWEIKRYAHATLVNNENYIIEIPIKVLDLKRDQAKQIEREQIIAAYDQGEFNDGCNGTAEEYYQKTYESSTL